MATQKTKAIIISLGGTPAPLVFSLNHQKPEYICFFVYGETRDTIDKDILPSLDFKPRHHDWIVIKKGLRPSPNHYPDSAVILGIEQLS